MIIFSTETPQTWYINNGCMFLFGTFTSRIVCIAKYNVIYIYVRKFLMIV